MRSCTSVSRIIAVLLLLAGSILLGAPSTASAVSAGCIALGGGPDVNPANCLVTSSIKSGTFTLTEALRITGTITVGPDNAATNPGADDTLTINITGADHDLIMESGSKIDGDRAGASRVGSTITINATRNITLKGTATISAQQVGGGCSGGKGGNINLTANSDSSDPATTAGDVTLEVGSVVTVSSVSAGSCPAGVITIRGTSVDIDGHVLSQSGTGKGGPISVVAACGLDVTGGGIISSKGRDPGADLVSLKGGCQVVVNGLVESTGAGHQVGVTNQCHGASHPAKPDNSTACVEIWAGGNLLNPGSAAITVNGPGGGQVNADVGTSGGAAGIGWIDIFAVGDINIIGKSAGTVFAVHANGGLGVNTDDGGLIAVKSTAGKVTASALALQASSTSAGGRGGVIAVGAKLAVNFNTASVFAEGDHNGAGALGTGGTIGVKSFQSSLTWTSGVGSARPAPPDPGTSGTIDLSACTAPIASTLGATFHPSPTTTPNPNACAGVPSLPTGVILPSCTSCVQICPT